MKHQKHSNWVCSENAEVYSPQNGYPYLYSEKIALATKGGVGVPYAPKMLALPELGWPPPPTKFWTQMRWVQSQRCQFSKCPFRTPTNLQYIIWIENGHPRKISKKSCNLVRDHVPWPLIAFMCPGFLWNACLCVKTQLTIKGENEIESNYDFWN